MTPRIPLTVEIYHHLLDVVKEKLLQSLEHEYESVTEIVNLASIKFIKDTNAPLPYNPARISQSKMKQILCDDLFPRRKTLVSVDKALFDSFKRMILERSFQLYEVDKNEVVISNRYAVETALWLTVRANELIRNDPYFDDELLLQQLDIQQIIIGSLNNVASIVGHSPTARQYEKHRKAAGGPSLSFIKNEFGTFNEAKRFAGLEERPRGKNQKYI